MPSHLQTVPSPSSRPQVVVVGAGFGGLSAARALCGKGADVTIVDRQNHHLFQPLLYQVATAGLSPADIAAPIRSVVKKHRATRVLLDEVTGVDTGRRLVLLADGPPLPYDYLVLATGATHSYFGREDWAKVAPGLKTIDDATRLRRNILFALEHAEALPAGPARNRQLTFVLVGGGPTGVEMAGAIAELCRHTVTADFRRIMTDQARVILVQAGPRLLPSFPENLSECARRSLERLGVEVLTGARVTEIDARGVSVDNMRIEAGCVIWCAGVQASPVARWLDVPADRTGRVMVGPDLSLPSHSEIFVIGDAAMVGQPDGSAVPGLAPAAKQMGKHAAQVIAARLAGTSAPTAFRYRDWGNLATIGRKRAVADFGFARMRGTLAWLFWCIAHIFFLVGFRNRLIVGANWLWHYVTFDRGARLITGLDKRPAPAPRELPSYHAVTGP